MVAVLALVEYVQRKHGTGYLLTGKVMSDPIKARFRMYRLAIGGNFFMSLKQLLLSEKKIRRLSLLQQHGFSFEPTF